MSLLKFELTEQHIALCRFTDWEQYHIRKEGIAIDNEIAKNHMYDEFGLILYGKPDVSPLESDPTSSEEVDWSDEQKEAMDKYFRELPTALQIMLHTGKFESGNYKTKHYDINWKKAK